MKDVRKLLGNGQVPAMTAPRVSLDSAGAVNEPELVGMLQEVVLPHIIANRDQRDPIRIWVPQCGSGEEAYVIAICLLQYLGERASNTRIQIFATDLDGAAIATARAGIYPQDRLRALLPQHLLRFFYQVDGNLKISPEVRELCVIAYQDLCNHPPLAKLDLIRCGHALSRLQPEVRQTVLATFFRALKNSGVLMLGEPVEIEEVKALFTPGEGAGGVFFKRTGAATNVHRGAAPQGPGVAGRGAAGIAIPANAPTQTEAGLSDLAACRIELARTQGELKIAIRMQQATLQELKRTRQESLASMDRLQSLYEELQSANEELQTSNEELHASKEQLQTSNEELISLNDELRSRNIDLRRISDEFANVLSAVNIPIVMLDKDRAIRSFTPAAETLFGLVAADVGRPIAHFRLGMNVPDLERMISAAIQKESETTLELQRRGRWYLLRVRPFRTRGDKVEGALIALLDIDELKRKERALQKDRNFISAILDAAGDLLVVVLDPQGRIVQFNRVCQELTGYSMEEVRGRRVWDFLLVPEEIEMVGAVFSQATGGSPVNYENYWVTKNGERRLISWRNSTVTGEDGALEFVIGTGIDQTDRAEAQNQAVESAATVHALLETAAQAIVAVDPDGRIILANAATEKMFGYSRMQLLGRPVEELIPRRLREKHALHRKNWFAQPLSRPMGAGLALIGLRSDGSEFPIEVCSSYLHNREGTIGVSFISDVTERRKNEETVLDYQRQLRQLAASLISGQETESRELARELHDVFSQELAALSMEISSMLHFTRSRNRLAPRLGELGKKIGRLAQEIQRTSRQLHPAILEELGLEAALREECDSLSRNLGVPVQFNATGMPPALPQEDSLCLYRVAQESLHNIRKHLGPTEVSVDLSGSPQAVSLRVADSGDGFDVAQARKRGGLGLISMEERTRLVNGKFSIQSQPGKGTVVEVVIPLKASTQA
jgi:PAS domain S-box-containing protein